MGVKTSLLGVTNGEPGATSEELGIKLTSPQTGSVSEGWFLRIPPDPCWLSLPPSPWWGAMLVPQRGPWMLDQSHFPPQCRGCLGEPEPASRTCGPWGWRWQFRGGFGGSTGVIAGWGDVKGLPVALMQGRQSDADGEWVAVSILSTSKWGGMAGTPEHHPQAITSSLCSCPAPSQVVPASAGTPTVIRPKQNPLC